MICIKLRRRERNFRGLLVSDNEKCATYSHSPLNQFLYERHSVSPCPLLLDLMITSDKSLSVLAPSPEAGDAAAQS